MPKPEPKTPTRPPAERQNSRGEKRRRRIFRSLHDCILDKGYVKTTLADVAQGADMSASHLLYYFKGKEDVLEQYFQYVSVQFTHRLDEMRLLAARDRIEALADFWFRGETGTRKEIGFMLECFGAAVNDTVLRVTKAEFDLRCKAFLAETFTAAPALFMPTARDAAELAYALMIGLRSAVYFDDDIDLEGAHSLFLGTLLRLTGFD
jgi:AcrR family transcriptional regulator